MTPNESARVPKDEWETMLQAEKTAHIAKRKNQVGKKPPGKNAKVARVGMKDKGDTNGTTSDIDKANAIAKTMQEQFISGVAAGRSLEADASEQQGNSQADRDGKAKPSVLKRKVKVQG